MKIIKNSQTGRALLTECGADEPIFLSDVYKKHTQAKKYHQMRHNAEEVWWRCLAF